MRKRLFPVSSLGEKRTTDDACEDEEGGADFIGLFVHWHDKQCAKKEQGHKIFTISAPLFFK